MTENMAFIIALLMAYIPFAILLLCKCGCAWTDLAESRAQFIKRNGLLNLVASITFFIVLVVVYRYLVWAFV
ncbi:TPA: hypothetical protein PXP53_001336 [Yersinia enterocolitica]|nr:hypothetical protein [Yersinia enterocolitica]